MLRIEKTGEPDFLKTYKKKYRPASWADYDKADIRGQLKAFILEHEQKYAKACCCVYCEKTVGPDTGHIEHVRPKSLFKTHEQDYSNLSVSCGKDGEPSETCGHFKGNSYSDDFIHPAEDDPSDFMRYDIMTGKVIPVSDNEDIRRRVEYTVNILNLNHNKLVRFRKTLFAWLKNVTNEEELTYYYEYGFPVLLEYYKKECLG